MQLGLPQRIRVSIVEVKALLDAHSVHDESRNAKVSLWVGKAFFVGQWVFNLVFTVERIARGGVVGFHRRDSQDWGLANAPTGLLTQNTKHSGLNSCMLVHRVVTQIAVSNGKAVLKDQSITIVVKLHHPRVKTVAWFTEDLITGLTRCDVQKTMRLEKKSGRGNVSDKLDQRFLPTHNQIPLSTQRTV